MLSQAYIAGAIALLALLGLAGANFAYDHGAPDSLSRRVPAMLGGVAFLIAVLWLDPWVAVTVAGGPDSRHARCSIRLSPGPAWS